MKYIFLLLFLSISSTLIAQDSIRTVNSKGEVKDIPISKWTESNGLTTNSLQFYTAPATKVATIDYSGKFEAFDSIGMTCSKNINGAWVITDTVRALKSMQQMIEGLMIQNKRY